MIGTVDRVHRYAPLGELGVQVDLHLAAFAQDGLDDGFQGQHSVIAAVAGATTIAVEVRPKGHDMDTVSSCPCKGDGINAAVLTSGGKHHVRDARFDGIKGAVNDICVVPDGPAGGDDDRPLRGYGVLLFLAYCAQIIIRIDQAGGVFRMKDAGAFSGDKGASGFGFPCGNGAVTHGAGDVIDLLQ